MGRGKDRKEVVHILKKQSVRIWIKYRKNEAEITILLRWCVAKA